MARKPGIHFPGALYHAIARGNQRQDLFISEADFRIYLSYLYSLTRGRRGAFGRNLVRIWQERYQVV